MRTILLAVAVLALMPHPAGAQTSTADLAKTSRSEDIAAFYNAQAAHDAAGQQAAHERIGLRKIADLLDLTADSLVLSDSGWTLHAAGHVSMRVNGTTIAASEVTIPLDMSQEGQFVRLLGQIQIDDSMRVALTAPIAIPTAR